MQLPGPVIARLLATWPIGRLTTLTGSGAPHAVPIVFAQVGTTIWSPVDGKPKRGGELARVRHLENDPRACLLLDHYDEDWTRLWWLRIDGEARVVTGADPERDAAVAALCAKYPQYQTVAVLREPATLIRLQADVTTSWCAGSEAVPRD